MDPVDRFYDAMNRKDMVAFAATIHPEFEMIVPQKPARGFKGKDQEVKNIASLCENHPDFVMTVLRKVRDGNEIWTEAMLNAARLEMAAVTIWTIDPKTETILSGRYYSEPVQREGANINAFMASLGAPA